MNKQILAIALLLALLLTLGACGKKDEMPEPEVTPESTPVSTPAPTEQPGDIGTEDLDDLELVEEVPTPASSTAEPKEEVTAENAEGGTPTAQPEEDSPVTPEPDDAPAQVIVPEMNDVPAQVIEPETAGHVPNSTEYENYLNMSGAEQVAFIESFDSPANFAAWFNAAQADYKAVSNPIEVTTGVIDFAADQETADE